MKTKLFLLVIIAVLFGFLVQARYEIIKTRDESFKRGIYFGVKSLRILVEKKENNISWDKIYSMALMAEMDEKERKPLYEPLNAPMGK